MGACLNMRNFLRGVGSFSKLVAPVEKAIIKSVSDILNEWKQIIGYEYFHLPDRK